MGLHGVPGDPAGMRALAGLLRGQAAVVAGAARGVEQAVKGIVFEGPAADRFRRELALWQFGPAAVTGELERLAALLERGAASVEAAQEEAARRAERERVGSGR